MVISFFKEVKRFGLEFSTFFSFIFKLWFYQTNMFLDQVVPYKVCCAFSNRQCFLWQCWLEPQYVRFHEGKINPK